MSICSQTSVKSRNTKDEACPVTRVVQCQHRFEPAHGIGAGHVVACGLEEAVVARRIVRTILHRRRAAVDRGVVARLEVVDQHRKGGGDQKIDRFSYSNSPV